MLAKSFDFGLHEDRPLVCFEQRASGGFLAASFGTNILWSIFVTEILGFHDTELYSYYCLRLLRASCIQWEFYPNVSPVSVCHLNFNEASCNIGKTFG